MLRRRKELTQQHANVPMDFADATLVAVAEETAIADIFTLDRRGFSSYRFGRKRYEIFLSLATVGMVRSIPWEGRGENLVAAVSWLAIVPWSAHLMRRGTGPALIAGAGPLEASSDVTQRLILLRDLPWGIILVLALDRASFVSVMAGPTVM